MSKLLDTDKSAPLMLVNAAPARLEEAHEESWWRRFWRRLWPRLKENSELGEAYLGAKVAQEQNTARKLAEEAAEIAARREREDRTSKLDDAAKFNALVDDIFADDGLPQEIKALKLTNLVADHPELEAQFERVKGMLERLRLTKGLRVEVVDVDPADPRLAGQLPAPAAPPSAEDARGKAKGSPEGHDPAEE